eukprot:239683-Rhodomonas_salina.1
MSGEMALPRVPGYSYMSRCHGARSGFQVLSRPPQIVACQTGDCTKRKQKVRLTRVPGTVGPRYRDSDTQVSLE